MGDDDMNAVWRRVDVQQTLLENQGKLIKDHLDDEREDKRATIAHQAEVRRALEQMSGSISTMNSTMNSRIDAVSDSMAAKLEAAVGPLRTQLETVNLKL